MTDTQGGEGENMSISIHIPRVGDDVAHQFPRHGVGFISIHIPRVGDDLLRRQVPVPRRISIHIPRVGDDLRMRREYDTRTDFNPHPPCGG